VTMTRQLSAWVAAAALASCILVGQGLVDVSVRAGGTTRIESTAGRAGFAYLTGLRRFAALVLWNRIEPQFHDYYEGRAVRDQTFVLPNLRVIVALDPQFIQAYYVAPWIVQANGRVADAVAIAREGVDNNPRSGLLSGAVEQADLAMRPDQVWADATQQWQGIRALRDIYAKAGLPGRVAETDRVTAQLESDLGGAPGFRDPDSQF
jgi:hypothetical protein